MKNTIKVAHSFDDIQEEKEIVLTLKDSGILGDGGDLNEEEDELENVDLVAATAIETRKKRKATRSNYTNPGEEADESEPGQENDKFSESGRNILRKYDGWDEELNQNRAFRVAALKKNRDVTEFPLSQVLSSTCPELQGVTPEHSKCLEPIQKEEKGNRKGFYIDSVAQSEFSQKECSESDKLNIKKENYYNLNESPWNTGLTKSDDGHTFFVDVQKSVKNEPVKIKKRNVKKPKTGFRDVEEGQLDQGFWDSLFADPPVSVTSAGGAKKMPSKSGREKESAAQTQPVAPSKVFLLEDQDDDKELYEQLERQRLLASSKLLDKNDVALRLQAASATDAKGSKDEGTSSSFDVEYTSTMEFCRIVQTPLEKLEDINSHLRLLSERPKNKRNETQSEESKSGAELSKNYKSNIRKKTMTNDDDALSFAIPLSERNDYNDVPNNIDSNDAIKSDIEQLSFLKEHDMGLGVSGALAYLKKKGELQASLLGPGQWYRESENAPLHMSTNKDEIRLDYKDAYGVPMTPKEAFQNISWIFHGKGPGRKKLEKKLRKMELEKATMANPIHELPTLRALSRVQKNESKPYLVLTGATRK